MFKLFSRIILSNWRSLIILFVVILFASTGFITLRQITNNIESSVASETRPLFGADLIVSPRGYATGDILPLISPYLLWETYQFAERREFSTTLIDREGKAWLIKVVAYSGSYPQRGIMKTEGIQLWKNNEVSGWIFEDSPFSAEWPESRRIWVTPWLIGKFASGGVITIDGRELEITDKILESSDLGFSLGTENHLIVLPSGLLSGSLLLSSGSRLDQDLMITFTDERRASIIAEELKKVLPEELYRIRTYEERTERNLDTVETLTDYIMLILLVSSIFAFIILRSAHENFYESLSRTLRVTEILWLSRERQQKLLLMLYSVIVPTGFLMALGISYLCIILLQTIPEASEFQFFWGWVPYALTLLTTLVVMAWWPVWWTFREDNLPVFSERFEKILSFFPWEKTRESILFLISPARLVPFFLGIIVLMLLFENPLFALFVWIGTGVFFLVFGSILWFFYRCIFSRFGFLRERRFYIFDALRTLVRPLMPTLPITISLICVTVFFLVFASFSLAFRSKLVIDSGGTANIYAINILKQDREKVEKVVGTGALIYDIIRARISGINGKTLTEHFDGKEPSGEFTREFNITTTPLENKILKWKNTIGKWEVSVDDEFSRRLGIDIGDRVTFLLSGREMTLMVASIRESVREGFRPFFYFSFDPREFANAPRTYFVAEYSSDTEAWKRSILGASGPHVTFIDIESILAIVRDISSKVLSVIALFGLVVLLFAIWAIIAFFARVWPIEDMKSRLYSLFWASPSDIRTSLRATRGMIFLVSYILSILIWGILSYVILSFGGFFSFSLPDFLMIALIIGGGYIALFFLLRPKK